MKSQSVLGLVCSKCLGMYMERDHKVDRAAREASLTARRPSGMIRDAEAPAQGMPMTKVAIAAAALLVIALLALPGLVGSITEANVRDRVEAIDASVGMKAELAS